MSHVFLLAALLAVAGCSTPTTDGFSVDVLGARSGATSAYVLTPALLRYDVTPGGSRLRRIARFDHEVQTYFYSDSLFVASEVFPGEENRVSVVDTKTGRRQSWRYAPACSYDEGRDQMSAKTVREGGQTVTYWGYAGSAPGDGAGYALTLGTWTLRTGPTVRAPVGAVRVASGMSGRAEAAPAALPPGYAAYGRRGSLRVVRDTARAWGLWDGARLFPLDVRPVRVPRLD